VYDRGLNIVTLSSTLSKTLRSMSYVLSTENYEQRLLTDTLQALADKEERIRAAADSSDPSLLVSQATQKSDRDLALAIGDMMEQLLAQADEDIRAIAGTL
jgi:RNA polymerase-binding transcription factor DksA